jgi:hypothetical protein
MLPSSDNTHGPAPLKEGSHIRASAYSVSWILIGVPNCKNIINSYLNAAQRAQRTLENS